MNSQTETQKKKYYYYKKVENPQKPGVKKIEIEENLRNKVIELRTTEKSVRQIAKKAGISEYYVRRIISA